MALAVVFLLGAVVAYVYGSPVPPVHSARVVTCQPAPYPSNEPAWTRTAWRATHGLACHYGR